MGARILVVSGGNARRLWSHLVGHGGSGEPRLTGGDRSDERPSHTLAILPVLAVAVLSAWLVVPVGPSRALKATGEPVASR